MSYVSPNTDIAFLRGCPLDKTYDHTLWFNTKSEQSNYFLNLTKEAKSVSYPPYTYYFSTLETNGLSKLSYQRVNRNTIRVEIPSDLLLDCNYLMFRNSAWSDKWFYAFIDRVEYVSNKVAEVEYTIDVMQTWFLGKKGYGGDKLSIIKEGDYYLDMCYVEREHSSTDNIGDNIVPESFSLSDYVIHQNVELTTGEMGVLIYSSVEITLEEVGDENFSEYRVNPGETLSGTLHPVYNGYWMYFVPLNNVDDYNQVTYMIDVANTKGENPSITCVMCPQTFFVRSISTPGWCVPTTASFEPFTDSKPLITNISINNSKPKNNKCFTSPYNKIVVYSNGGDVEEYNIEDFENGEVQFEFAITPHPIPSYALAPKNYKNNEDAFWELGVTKNTFTICPYTNDVFARWWAQHQESYNTGLMAKNIGLFMSVAGVAASVYTGGSSLALLASVGGVLSSATGVAQDVASLQDKTKAGNIGSGLSTASGIGDVTKKILPSIYQKTLKPEYISIIDNYFTTHGYATKTTKLPNLDVRPYFNYIKTIGCVVSGSIPSDDMDKICSIFDKGITFWKVNNGVVDVGNYTLDNSPS